MPILEGWEVSPDRGDMYEKIISTDPVGDTILTTKCKLDKENGLLVVADNGFAWRIKMGFKQASVMRAAMSSGKSKWVRWHDVANITPKKDGQILMELKLRKKGNLIKDGKGNYKLKKWKFTMQPNKGEPKPHFLERRKHFNSLMIDVFLQHKEDTDPPTSDSRM